MRLFENRLAAAAELSRHLAYLRPEQPLVLGLANEGLPVAETIARSLDSQLDVLLLQRLHAPVVPERIVGVVDEFGRISMIETSARWHQISNQQMIEPARKAFGLLQRKRGKVRAVLPSQDVINRTVVIVDQGIGTGARMLGAVASVRDRGARKIVVAAPAGASSATWQLHEMADQVVIPHRPTRFVSVEAFYEHYYEVSDDLMLAILQKWVGSRPTADRGVQTILHKVTKEDGRIISCEIDLPPNATRGSGPYPAVLFAHGFESDCHSKRTVPISQRLAKRNIIGVRLDFTGHGRSEGSVDEATDQQMINDLQQIHRSVSELNEVDTSRIGLCGSGTGGMIALHYAAAVPEIRALVIRGPVCGEEVEAASKVEAPTLLIHAERDTALRDSIEAIHSAIRSTHELLTIPDSSRIFNDPISRELMIGASVDWLTDRLVDAPERGDDPTTARVHTLNPGEERLENSE